MAVVIMTTNLLIAGQTEFQPIAGSHHSNEAKSREVRKDVVNPDQKSTQAKPNPCLDPVLLKVRKEGLRVLKITEIPTYFIRGRQCRKIGATREAFRRINQQQLEMDYTNGHRLQGWTSCWTYIVTSTVLFYFLESAVP